MRAELRAIQKRTNVTFIYITHDQGEALAMSDRVGVMSQGRAAAGRRAAGDLQSPGQRLRRLVRRREQHLPRPGDRSRQRLRADRDGVRHLHAPRSGPASPRRDRPSSTCGPEHSILARRPASDANALPVEIADVAFEGNFINVQARGDAGGAYMAAGHATIRARRCRTPGRRLHMSFAAEHGVMLADEPAGRQ